MKDQHLHDLANTLAKIQAVKNRLDDYENGKKALTLPELNELHVLLEAFKGDAARQSVEASEKGWR